MHHLRATFFSFSRQKVKDGSGEGALTCSEEIVFKFGPEGLVYKKQYKGFIPNILGFVDPMDRGLTC